MKPLLWILPAIALAQDPYTVAPNNYKLELDNPWVRITRVTYRPHEKVPMHTHPTVPVVYVYTTDSGPVKFMHEEGIAYERRPQKAGAVRFSKGAVERHTIESESDTLSETLRIELKTDAPEVPKRDVRFAASENNVFENAQVRLVSLTCAPHQTCAAPQSPAVVVTVNNHSAKFYEANAPVIENTTDAPMKQIRIELKTQPAK
jgi:hypothetical protein